MERPSSALRRKSHVFVEIPPSPLTSAKSSSANPRAQQENTPLKSVAMNVDPVDTSPTRPNKLKRKSMDAPQTEQTADARPPKSKKPKTEARARPEDSMAAGEKKEKGQRRKSDSIADTVYCHQCARRYDPSAVVQCTYLRSGKQCVLKYCKACMRNRYQQDADDVRSRSPTESAVETRAKHAAGVQYLFQCPRCSDICNCRCCRKAKGLPPTGDMNLQARKAARAPAAHEGVSDINEANAPGRTQPGPRVPTIEASSTEVSVTLPKKKATGKKVAASRPGPHTTKPKPHVLIPPSPHAKKSRPSEQVGAAEKLKPRAGRPKLQPVPKVTPPPVWNRLPTPLSYDCAVQRLNLREYLLRFAHLTDIARTHLEELEEIGSTIFGSTDSDDEEVDGASRLVGWIPEASLKAIIIGLLSLVSKDPESESDGPALSKAIQTIKASGASLNKIWAALASLRETSSLTLPDPLPPAVSMMRHSTRSASGSSTVVFSTAQLVPVVDALVDRTLQTKAVREDFERASSQEKDLVRAARELTAEENARYKVALDTKGTTVADRKAIRAAHKETLCNIEHAQKVAVAECIPRFAPLGRDADGRAYYVLTPGVVEREAALDLLEGGKGEVRLGKRRDVATETQRKRMRHWSWLVAVWGRKPEGAEVARRSPSAEAEAEEEDEAEENDDAEGWWAFYQPEEVAKLAEWLAMKHDIDLDAKRASKEPEDVVIPAATDGAPAIPTEKRRSRASTSSQGSVAGPSRPGPRTFASLNKGTEDDMTDFESRLDSSDEEEDARMDAEAYERRGPTKRELRSLAKALKEYADLLGWRIKRASKESKETKESAEDLQHEKAEKTEKVGKSQKKDKGKSVQREEAISPQTFYGK
ncbi:hypothetical protein C8Q77DRAFT_243894 [Trametes polyzona]|nr:hypothetical protein C8Q77DRAFT_243894 [Trametes polyzona]